IAREALKLVMRTEEERPGEGWRTPLGAAIASAVGGATWNDVRTFVYGGDRGKIGTLARVVARAAETGDEDAARILSQAGRELARLANSPIARPRTKTGATGAGGAR